MEPSKKPLNVLLKKLHNDVLIRLKNDVEYRGKMIDCDSHMNIILEGASEHRNSPGSADRGSVTLGDVILRGSNILYVCVNPQSHQ